MKKVLLLVMIVFLAACEQAAVEEVVIEVNEVTEESSVSEEVAFGSQRIAVIGERMPANAYRRIMDAFNNELDWYTYLNIDVLDNYQTVYVFYDASVERRLVDAGYRWPQIKPYELVRQTINATEFVFINFTESESQSVAVDAFIELRSEIEDQVIPLIQPLTKSENSTNGLASPDICRVPHDNRLRNDYYEVNMGFPRSSNRLPHDRNINAIVIFVEFPEYRASRSIEELNEFFEDRYVKMTNDFIGAMSYGLVQHEFYYHDEIIMTELPRTSGPLAVGEDYVSEFVRYTLTLADPRIDFTPYDYVIIHVDPTLPLSVANFAWANTPRPEQGYVTEEKTFLNVNAWSAEMVRPNHEWVGVHEIIHLYGLVDYYSRPENVWRGHEWVGNFDLMSNATAPNIELLLWSRWFIGWVTPDDVDCIDGRTTIEPSEHILNSTMGLDGTKGVIIRISEFEVILIERKDNNEYCRTCDGGLIVSRYNASISSMYGPLRIVRPDGSVDRDFEDAFIRKGDFIEVAGIRIDVLEEGNKETLIQISTT